MGSKHQRVFGILRFFSVASLICILLAAILLAWLYGWVAVSGIVGYGERNNLMLTQGLLNAIRPELSVYLADEALHHDHPLPEKLADSVRHLMENTGVVRVDILDDEGIVVFSTAAEGIGRNLAGTPGFAAAGLGRVHSKMGWRAAPFSVATGEEGAALIDSYIPITAGGSSVVRGAFAVQTDVWPLMAEIERSQLLVFFAGMAIMAVLYLALLSIVHRAERIIRGQDLQLRERSHALELLSSQLITAQESEKRRLATGLHEGIAQALCSIKFRLEQAGELLSSTRPVTAAPPQAVIPLLQTVIEEVRALAMELRPPSLDELGVLAALDWYQRQLKASHPGLALRLQAEIGEEEIPPPVKVVLYRALQQLVQLLVRKGAASAVHVMLNKAAGDALRLEVTDDGALSELDAGQREDRTLRLRTLREFIGLSGGAMEVRMPNGAGGTTVCAEWPL